MYSDRQAASVKEAIEAITVPPFALPVDQPIIATLSCIECGYIGHVTLTDYAPEVIECPSCGASMLSDEWNAGHTAIVEVA